MNDTRPAQDTKTSRPARLQVFASVHKGLRRALCDLLDRLGTTAFDDAAAVEACLAELEEVMAFSLIHAELEDRFLAPALDRDARGARATFDDGHATLRRFVSELRAAAAALSSAPSEQRALVGRTLYLHLSLFVAHDFSHMAEEERVLQPLLERLYTDQELGAIQREVHAAISESERRISARWILLASNPAERLALVKASLASAPAASVLGLLEAERASLPADEHARLVAECSRPA